MKKSGFSIKAAAEGSFWFGRLSTSGGIQMNEEQAKEFSSKRTDNKEAYIGGLPTLDGKWESWARGADASPYPIIYTLKDIGKLFDAKYSLLNQTDLDKKKELLYGEILQKKKLNIV